MWHTATAVPLFYLNESKLYNHITSKFAYGVHCHLQSRYCTLVDRIYIIDKIIL